MAYYAWAIVIGLFSVCSAIVLFTDKTFEDMFLKGALCVLNELPDEPRCAHAGFWFAGSFFFSSCSVYLSVILVKYGGAVLATIGTMLTVPLTAIAFTEPLFMGPFIETVPGSMYGGLLVVCLGTLIYQYDTLIGGGHEDFDEDIESDTEANSLTEGLLPRQSTRLLSRLSTLLLSRQATRSSMTFAKRKQSAFGCAVGNPCNNVFAAAGLGVAVGTGHDLVDEKYDIFASRISQENESQKRVTVAVVSRGKLNRHETVHFAPKRFDTI